jgi:hypothetical protein
LGVTEYNINVYTEHTPLGYFVENPCYTLEFPKSHLDCSWGGERRKIYEPKIRIC